MGGRCCLTLRMEWRENEHKRECGLLQPGRGNEAFLSSLWRFSVLGRKSGEDLHFQQEATCDKMWQRASSVTGWLREGCAGGGCCQYSRSGQLLRSRHAPYTDTELCLGPCLTVLQKLFVSMKCGMSLGALSWLWESSSFNYFIYLYVER